MDNPTVNLDEQFFNVLPDQPEDNFDIISAASWEGKPLPPPPRWRVEGWQPVWEGTALYADGLLGKQIPALQTSAGARAFRFAVADLLLEGGGKYLVAVCDHHTEPKEVLRVVRRLGDSVKTETWIPPKGQPIFGSDTLSRILLHVAVPKGVPLLLPLAKILCTDPARATVLGWQRHWG